MQQECVRTIRKRGHSTVGCTRLNGMDGCAEVFVWGRGEYGRLGLGDRSGSSRLRATLVKAMEGHSVVQVRCVLFEGFNTGRRVLLHQRSVRRCERLEFQVLLSELAFIYPSVSLYLLGRRAVMHHAGPAVWLAGLHFKAEFSSGLRKFGANCH